MIALASSRIIGYMSKRTVVTDDFIEFWDGDEPAGKVPRCKATVVSTGERCKSNGIRRTKGEFCYSHAQGDMLDQERRCLGETSDGRCKRTRTRATEYCLYHLQSRGELPESMRCKAIRADDERCRALSMADSKYCMFHIRAWADGDPRQLEAVEG